MSSTGSENWQHYRLQACSVCTQWYVSRLIFSSQLLGFIIKFDRAAGSQWAWMARSASRSDLQKLAVFMAIMAAAMQWHLA